jgi:hypothetical protein
MTLQRLKYQLKVTSPEKHIFLPRSGDFLLVAQLGTARFGDKTGT